jgi:hypothetical protein
MGERGDFGNRGNLFGIMVVKMGFKSLRYG